MNLDDLDRFRQLDPQRMLEQIDGLPDQLAQAWDLGQGLPLPRLAGIRQVLIAGMGGSAIGADLAAAYGSPAARIPVIVWRDYGLPAFVQGPETLVIASSHSGDTEETLSAFAEAGDRGAQRLALTTGGQLGEQAGREGVPLWTFQHRGQPRAAVGYSFGLLLAALTRIGCLPDPAAEVAQAVQAMREQQAALKAETPVVRNLAKRMAGQFMDRWPVVIGADLLAPVARRWRTQVSEIAKAPAQFEALPEADHNLVAGVEHPEKLFERTLVVFLLSRFNEPRNQRRLEVTRQLMMVSGFNTDLLPADGDGRLAQQWTCLHLGDYIAYYLAMAYGVDPTPVLAIEDLKLRLGEAGLGRT
jgi:glucose/mannose-6-phosphate isomerase